MGQPTLRSHSLFEHRYPEVEERWTQHNGHGNLKYVKFRAFRGGVGENGEGCLSRFTECWNIVVAVHI